MKDQIPTKQLNLLQELRKKEKRSQDWVADYFGLSGNRRRESVGRWERGIDRPSLDKKNKFVDYLIKILGLRTSPNLFLDLWTNIAVRFWGWPQLTRKEFASIGIPPEFYHQVLYPLAQTDQHRNFKIKSLDDLDIFFPLLDHKLVYGNVDEIELFIKKCFKGTVHIRSKMCNRVHFTLFI